MDILLAILSWVVPLASGWYVIPKLRARYVTDGKGGRTFELTAGDSSEVFDYEDDEEEAEDDGDAIRIEEQIFDASQLEVTDLPAMVEVQSDADLMTCRVEIEGRRDLVQSIKAEVVDGTLKLTSTHGKDAYLDDDDLPTVTVTIPHGTPVEVRAYAGRIDVDDTGGPFKGSVEGDAELNVGSVRDADLTNLGDGSISVECVEEVLCIHSAGSGDTDVQHGEVDNLTITAASDGDVWFGGTAAKAELFATGSGDIGVDEVSGALKIDITGSGDVTVHNRTS